MSKSREKLSIRITDGDLKKAGWSNYEYLPVNHDQVGLPVENSQITQGGIGNCFMVATLSSIVEHDPLYLNKVLKLSKDGKTAEVTFIYDSPTGKSQEITYVIDATKMSRKRGFLNLGKSDINNHQHDAIYLMEKAYALHQIYIARNTTVDEFIYLGKDKVLMISTEESKENKSPNQAQPATIKMPEYRSALAGGKPRDVLSALSLPAKEHMIRTGMKLKDISDVIQLCVAGKMNFKDNKGTFDKFFNNDHDAVAQFLKYATDLNKDQQQLLKEFFDQAFDIAKSDRTLTLEQLGNQFDQLYQKIFTGGDKSLPIMDEALKNKFIKAAVDCAPPRKVGLGQYTGEQNALYTQMHDLIHDGHVLATETTKINSKNPESTNLGIGETVKKGLVGEHAYQVVDCYERGDLKFVLVRNPWAEHVRDYSEKEHVTASGETKRVFDAVARDQLNAGDQQEGYRDRYRAKNSARSLSSDEIDSRYTTQGYFEVELTDYLKNFAKFHYTQHSVEAGIPAQVFGTTAQLMRNVGGLHANTNNARLSGGTRSQSPEPAEPLREPVINLNPDGSSVVKRSVSREEMEKRLEEHQKLRQSPAKSPESVEGETSPTMRRGPGSRSS